MKISVVTPSVRREFLDVVYRCLKRQTLSPREFEWIIVMDGMPSFFGQTPFNTIYASDPDKREGDYYSLNKAWNHAFRRAHGELILSITDGIWFPPSTLERLWFHYQEDPKACVSTVGHQYDRVENGKPEHLVWRDPRTRDNMTFWQIPPLDYELCLAAIPLAAIKAVGGVDEEFDKYAALSEKEMCIRIEKLGYTFWLDSTLEYRAMQHPRISPDWDTRYHAGIAYFNNCLRDIDQRTRLVLDYVPQT